MHEISIVRLYTLRICYLILAVGLGLYMWPSVIRHTPDLAIAHGIQCSLLAGLGLTAVLGLRYPVQMIPLLLFELIWKTIYLVAFALPLWSAHQITDAAAQDIQACLMVVIFIPLIPWRYVVRHYIMQPGDRWKRD
jgi:hypothetical protein